MEKLNYISANLFIQINLVAAFTLKFKYHQNKQPRDVLENIFLRFSENCLDNAQKGSQRLRK